MWKRHSTCSNTDLLIITEARVLIKYITIIQQSYLPPRILNETITMQKENITPGVLDLRREGGREGGKKKKMLQVPVRR